MLICSEHEAWLLWFGFIHITPTSQSRLHLATTCAVKSNVKTSSSRLITDLLTEAMRGNRSVKLLKLQDRTSLKTSNCQIINCSAN